MTQALWIAKTGLDAQQTRMAVISNNLANTNTTGFKRDRASFEDLLYQTVRQPGGASSEQTQLPSGLSTGTGVRVAATAKQFTQGNLSQTGNPLDVAINGRGFFEVLMPDGSPAYTRDGSFQINANGELVTNSGYPVQPGLQFPEGAQSVTIAADGTVSVQVAGEPEAVQVGGPGTGGIGLLAQGSLESSNVNTVEELVSMIETQRAYETNAKAISTVDQMLGFLNQNL